MRHKPLRVAGTDGLDNLLRLQHTQCATSCSFDHKIEKQYGWHTQSMRYDQGEKVIGDEHGVSRHVSRQCERFPLALSQVVIL